MKRHILESNETDFVNFGKIISTKMEKNQDRINKAKTRLCSHPHFLFKNDKMRSLFDATFNVSSNNLMTFNEIIEKGAQESNHNKNSFIKSISESLKVRESNTPLFMSAIGLGTVVGVSKSHKIPKLTRALTQIILQTNKLVNEKLSVQRNLLLFSFISDLLQEITDAWHELSLLTSNVLITPNSYIIDQSALESLYSKIANPILRKNG